MLRDVAFKNLSLPSSLSFSQLHQLPRSSIMSSFMPSLKTLSKAVWTYSQLAFISSSGTVLGGSPDTCSNPQTSCQNTSAVANTCCFNAPGGQLLQVRRHLHGPSPSPSHTHTLLTDSILGRRSFHRTRQFVDHTRSMVCQSALSILSSPPDLV